MVRSIVGRYNPEGTDPNAFAGKVHVRSLFGLCASMRVIAAFTRTCCSRVQRRRREVICISIVVQPSNWPVRLN